MKLKSGNRAIQLRRLITKINAEIKTFDDIKNEYIRATGKEEIKPGDPEYIEVATRLSEAAEAEVDVEVIPLIEEADLDGIEISAKEIDGLIAIGLLRLEESTTSTPIAADKL